VLNWTISALITAFIVAVMLVMTPDYPDVADPHAVFRTLCTRLIYALTGIVMMTGCILYFDWITPHDWMHKLEEHPLACAIVLAIVLYVVGSIFML